VLLSHTEDAEFSFLNHQTSPNNTKFLQVKQHRNSFLSHTEGAEIAEIAEIFREDVGDVGDVGDVAGTAGLAGMFTQMFLDRINMMLEMPTDRRD